MKKSHFNDEFLALLGPIISRFFACSNEEKTNKPKQHRLHALVPSLWPDPAVLLQPSLTFPPQSLTCLSGPNGLAYHDCG